MEDIAKGISISVGSAGVLVAVAWFTGVGQKFWNSLGTFTLVTPDPSSARQALSPSTQLITISGIRAVFIVAAIGFFLALGALIAVTFRPGEPARFNITFVESRIGANGTVKPTEPENLFSTTMPIQNSEDYAFCTVSDVKINKAGGSCRMLRETSRHWTMVPTDAECQATCFKLVVSQ